MPIMIFELRASSFILNFALFFIKKSFAATNAVLLLPLAKACFCTIVHVMSVRIVKYICLISPPGAEGDDLAVFGVFIRLRGAVPTPAAQMICCSWELSKPPVRDCCHFFGGVAPFMRSFFGWGSKLLLEMAGKPENKRKKALFLARETGRYALLPCKNIY